ncbi:extracellular solute-binding protein [Cohnella sp. REN36]|uniref:extracellular solute-binding protein n=1 Tax=Cohnella sp. REN36 TaxID=2887347 RepID=UPI001D155337|nr:extracellular solute-binding protein [Cohnella sp. REN36]MCC3376742.1 extracellular solute-binding protein [Cohnella sp. REN36]
MKKTALLMLAVCMAWGVTAGCANKNEDRSAASGSPAGSEGAQTEKVKIDMVIASWKGGGWPDNNHPIIQYIDKKFNVDLQIQWVPNANFVEKLNVIAASGKMPDVIRLDSPALFLKWASQGAFLDLQPYLSQYPTLQKIATPEEWALLNPQGKVYGIPIYETAQNTIYVRADWLDKLGIPRPEADAFTIDQFYEIAKAFATQDPDGNGKPDTYGFSALGNAMNLGMPELQAAFGIANGWKEEGGELIPAQVQSKEWKAYLNFMQKAYQEGVLDKDFVTNTNFNEKYAQGKIGFADMHYQFSRQTTQELQKIAPNAEFARLSPPIGEGGARGNSTPSSGKIKVVLGKDMNAQKRDRILELLDWWVSAEGEDILKNGIEGVHYRKGADGTYEMTDTLKAEGEGRQSLMWNWILRGNTNTFNIYKWSAPEWAQGMEQSIEDARKYPYRNVAEGYLPSSPAYAEKGSTLGDKFLKAVVEIIAGKKPVESIDDAIAEWKSSGGDQIIQEVNAAYKAKA